MFSLFSLFSSDFLNELPSLVNNVDILFLYRDTGIQGYRDKGIKGYRDTGIQG